MYMYVKLQPYRQQSVVVRSNQKLSLTKYLTDGRVAYKLELSKGSQIHSVFHVSQLKILVGNIHTSNHLPFVLTDILVKEHEMVLERKMVNRHESAATMVLIKWMNELMGEATLDFLYEIQRRFSASEP